MHRDYGAFFLGNLLLDTILVVGFAFGPYAVKKLRASRGSAKEPPQPDDGKAA